MTPDELESYTSFQISASESLRDGGSVGLSKEERIECFQEAKMWAIKAMLVSRENIYYRFLAMSQATCAEGMIIIIENEVETKVLHANHPDSVKIASA